MKRVAGAVALVLVGVLFVDQLADLTQTRPERVRRDYATRITMEVRNRRDRPSILAAEALWATCRWRMRRMVVDTEIQAVGDYRFEVTITPELGATGRRRLKGCIEDVTLDRIKGNVVSMVDVRR